MGEGEVPDADAPTAATATELDSVVDLALLAPTASRAAAGTADDDVGDEPSSADDGDDSGMTSVPAVAIATLWGEGTPPPPAVEEETGEVPPPPKPNMPPSMDPLFCSVMVTVAVAAITRGYGSA